VVLEDPVVVLVLEMEEELETAVLDKLLQLLIQDQAEEVVPQEQQELS
jgi:hypothetical protein